MISYLILLDISWCSRGLVYKVWLGHLKGLSEVCNNALKGWLFLHICFLLVAVGRLYFHL